MPKASINGVGIAYDVTGTSDVPMILVHGSWTSRGSWAPLVEALAKSFRVVTYDRRGHSESDGTTRQGSIRDDVSDLASLIQYLKLSPAWVTANSFGATIALRLAGEHPELLRGLIAHEPPCFSALTKDPEGSRMLDEFTFRSQSVAELIAAGDHVQAAQHFIDDVALGPGSWEQLPEQEQYTLASNAETFRDELQDPEALDFDPAWIRRFSGPLLLTTGEQSPPIFRALIDRLAATTPAALEIRRMPDAGHVPHLTHPRSYAEIIRRFVEKAS
jgi:pimeloyl-ACP methyl ester carboxylesterase